MSRKFAQLPEFPGSGRRFTQGKAVLGFASRESLVHLVDRIDGRMLSVIVRKPGSQRLYSPLDTPMSEVGVLHLDVRVIEWDAVGHRISVRYAWDADRSALYVPRGTPKPLADCIWRRLAAVEDGLFDSIEDAPAVPMSTLAFAVDVIDK